MHRLAGIEVEHVAHPVCQPKRVGSVLLEALVDQKLRGLSRAFEPAAELAAQARVLDLLGHLSAEVWGQDLPLDGQHAVALQVTEGAVVGDDLEAVAEGLQAAPRQVPAVPPAAPPPFAPPPPPPGPDLGA